MERETSTSSLLVPVKVNGWSVPPIVSIARSRMNCLLMVTWIGDNGGRFLISSPSSIGTFTNEVAIAEDPSAMVLPELEEELGAE